MSKKSSAGRPSIVTEDAVLDATRAGILAVGVRRTTLADVARRLGVSRPTIYRRWPDVGSLVAAVVTREWLTLVDDSDLVAHDRPGLASALVQAARAMRDHPLLRKVIAVDPEWLLPYILDRRGASQDAGLAAVQHAIAAGQRAGELRSGNPALLARTVILLLQSAVLSARTMADAVDLDALDAELCTVLDRYLAPDTRAPDTRAPDTRTPDTR